MCGIVGFIDKSGKYTDEYREAIVRKMLLKIRHRGGEAEGVEIRDNVTIGHTRLSIVDRTLRANQPFKDSNSILAYNGEIYNHEVLRKKYCKNKTFNSHSDTATLFELLKQFPIEKVLSVIQGMYAFSFLNVRSKELILALDKFSIKPLYYIDNQSYFAWASEVKAFSELPDFRFGLNEECLGEYLIFRHIASESTLFENVRKMLPGEYLTYSFKSNIYFKTIHYQPFVASKLSKQSLRKTLATSVERQLMSDAPIGIQLSGGLDSSLVTLWAQKSSKLRLHTFSIGLSNPKWNEFHYSNAVAKRLGTFHHRFTFSQRDFVSLLPKLTYHLDEPIVHPNTIPMYILARKARKFVKVLLTGEGADEVFHGYRRYSQKKIASNREILFSNAFIQPDLAVKILKPKQKMIFQKRRLVLNQASRLSNIDKIKFYDISTYLPHVLLRQDKAGMAANIENRVPFLYEPVVNLGLHPTIEIGKLGTKTEIKKIALKYFPQDFVLREKCGFGLPISGWLKDKDCLLPYLESLKGHQLIKKYFHRAAIVRLVREHLNEKHDHSSLLFTILALAVWYDTFLISPKQH